MGQPGMVGTAYECGDCGAELQRSGRGFRCPWSLEGPVQVEAGVVWCGKPYAGARPDLGAAYARDTHRKATRP